MLALPDARKALAAWLAADSNRLMALPYRICVGLAAGLSHGALVLAAMQHQPCAVISFSQRGKHIYGGCIKLYHARLQRGGIS